MPEGDTIHRIARRLDRELGGRTLERLELRDRGEIRDLSGCTMDTVEARGKHLLLHLSGGWTLRVHLGMHGRWVRRHAGEPRPPRPTALLAAGDAVYTCERAYRAELVRTTSLRTHPALARLGPDLLADPPDVDGAVARARLGAHREREIGDVLLDQRVAAGIGNVYKSEVLFRCLVRPRAPVRALDDATLRALFGTAAALMRSNLDTRRRTTVPLRDRPTPGSPRLWVYGRTGRPCLRCGTAIERFLQGEPGRTTWFCPVCQSSPSG